MISTCACEAGLVEEDGTLITSSMELSISMTGTAGTVDGMLDDSTVTTAEEAGAGDAVGVLADIGDPLDDDTSIISNYG